MHIWDGVLDVKTWGTLAGVSGGVVGLSSLKVRHTLPEEKMPLLGITAAFVFAAQMINIPIGGGTSAHFLGAFLTAILVGPFAATLVMTIVLLAQSLVFQDGGLLALGANIFNMGIISVWGGYFFYKTITFYTKGSFNKLGLFLGSWFSIVLAATGCALELYISGVARINLIMPAIVGINALIGIAEGIITLAAVQLIYKVRPDVINNNFEKLK